jgi:cell division protein FtsN
MSEYLRAQKDAERERARYRALQTDNPQPPRRSMEEPGSQLQWLFLDSCETQSRPARAQAAKRESARLRWRKRDRRGRRVMPGAALVLGLALLLGSSSAGWLERSRQKASMSETADTETSTIRAAKTTPHSAIATGEPAVLFRVQVGAFVSPDNAERLAERLRSEGFMVVSRTLHLPGTRETARRTLQIVRVGAYPTVRLAEHARAELARLGYVGFVVREP